MFEDNLPRDIIRELEGRYPTPESRKDLRLNDTLINEVFQILENLGYEISPSPDFPTEFFSATALSQFEEPIKQWIQAGKDNQPLIEQDYYIPTEQILRDLISQGWVIKPPKGV